MTIEFVENFSSDYARRRNDKYIIGEIPRAVGKGVLLTKRPPRDK